MHALVSKVHAGSLLAKSSVNQRRLTGSRFAPQLPHDFATRCRVRRFPSGASHIASISCIEPACRFCSVVRSASGTFWRCGSGTFVAPNPAFSASSRGSLMPAPCTDL